MLEPTISATDDPFTLDADNLIGVFTNFLQFDVANGAASPETIRTYLCNLGNIIRTGAGVGLSVASKKRRRTIPLLPELAELLAEYLKCRQTAGYSLELNGPLFVNLRRPERGECRLSLRGIRYIVDSYLIRLNLKSGNGQTRSAHSLRHTAGTLALQNGASLREVQDLLGHADPRTTAIYTHVGDKWLTNPALKLGIKLSPDPLPSG